MASITFFVFLTLALSFTTIHARESQFFAKVSNNIPQESQPLNTNENTNEKDLKFVPQTRETTQGSGYGLFGHESGQLPPSATTTNNNNENKNNNNNYLPTNLPENYNPVAYTTPIHSSTQDIPNEFRYEPQAYKGDNNNMYNSQNQEEFLQTNDDNLFNSQNQDEFMQTNDANMYNSGKQKMGTNGGNNNNYEKQGMSDTRFLNNGKYYYAGDNTYNSQNQGFGGARFVETQDSGNNNMFNNQKQGVNGYNNNQEMYNSGNQGMGENKYTTTTNNGNMYNPERQGMSDTRFLENGKYYYDLNLENQNLNSRGVRNGFETQGYYGNNDNSYDRYNTNVNGGYQNQEFQVNQDDQFNP
ncbi:E6 protein [Tanacetum coccineum]